jgi:hypothetical protein
MPDESIVANRNLRAMIPPQTGANGPIDRNDRIGTINELKKNERTEPRETA